MSSVNTKLDSSTLSRTSSIFQAADDMWKTGRQDSDSTVITLVKPSEILKSDLSLHEACRSNSIERVRRLINDKVDVNVRNRLDRTSLHWAAANGHLEVVEMLLNAGAELEFVDKYGMTALLWSAWFGHTNVVRLLVNSGANVFCTNMQNMNVLHCAAQNNHIEVIQFIFDSFDGLDLDLCEKHDRTALHLSSEKGHEATVEKLLAAKADVHRKDKLGQTAVHLASINGHEEVLKKLLLFGVEVDDRDSDGCTALYLAAANGHQRIVDILLSCNADPNAENTKEMTALMIAASNGHIQVISDLLDHKCNVNAKNGQGNTALHLAASGSSLEVVHVLISANCDLDSQNKRQQTPLHVAVENANADIVEALLVAGVDIQLQEKAGKTALGLASRASLIGIVDMIIKAERFQSSDQDDATANGIQCGQYHHCFYRTSCNALSVGTSRPSSKASCRTSSAPPLQLKRPSHDAAEHMKDILWRLATKQLKPNDWKRLAKHWRFTDAHIKALEHQYTGNESYKEHGYRLLLIWLHGLRKDDNPIKQLFEALVAVERRELAEQIRKRCNVQVEKSSGTLTNYCGIS